MSSVLCIIKWEDRKGGSMTQNEMTPLAVFIDEELERLQWSQLQLEAVSGVPDSTIGRIRGGQEAKPSQLARLAKAFGRHFWYVIQRAGYALDDPGDPSADARRLGAIFADDPELGALHTQLLRLSLPNRRAVLRMIQALIGEQPDFPVPPGVE